MGEKYAIPLRRHCDLHASGPPLWRCPEGAPFSMNPRTNQAWVMPIMEMMVVNHQKNTCGTVRWRCRVFHAFHAPCQASY
jgi:hypothetical protein